MRLYTLCFLLQPSKNRRFPRISRSTWWSWGRRYQGMGSRYLESMVWWGDQWSLLVCDCEIDRPVEKGFIFREIWNWKYVIVIIFCKEWLLPDAILCSTLILSRHHAWAAPLILKSPCNLHTRNRQYNYDLSHQILPSTTSVGELFVAGEKLAVELYAIQMCKASSFLHLWPNAFFIHTGHPCISEWRRVLVIFIVW